MTFPSALKRLAEREPEKFEWVEKDLLWTDEGFIWKNRETKLGITRLKKLSQDDIDGILALIGWEYWVIRQEWEKYEFVWIPYIGKINTYHCAPVINSDAEILKFPDKLSAAKAALIAVVEKTFPVGGQNE